MEIQGKRFCENFIKGHSQTTLINIGGPLHIDIDCLEPGNDYGGNDLNDGHNTLTASERECQHLCKENADCVGFTWVKETWEGRERECWLKSKMDSFTPDERVLSGPKDCETATVVVETSPKAAEEDVCFNARDINGGNKCVDQLKGGSDCRKYLGWKDCDMACNLCACSTGDETGTMSHCNGHGVCEATCEEKGCSEARCSCDPGFMGDKCQINVAEVLAKALGEVP